MFLKRSAVALSVALISLFSVAAFAQAPATPAPKMATPAPKMGAMKMGKKSAKKMPPRDAKGHFMKAGAAPAKSGIVMDKMGRAHDAKTGKFVKMDKMGKTDKMDKMAAPKKP